MLSYPSFSSMIRIRAAYAAELQKAANERLRKGFLGVFGMNIKWIMEAHFSSPLFIQFILLVLYLRIKMPTWLIILCLV